MTTLRTERRGRFILTLIGEGHSFDIHLALHGDGGFHVFAAVVVENADRETALFRFDQILEALP